MAKGKFEAGKRPAKAAGHADPYAVRNKPQPAKEGRDFKLWPVLAAVAAVAVLVVGILIFMKVRASRAPQTPESSEAMAATTTAVPSTVPLEGMPRAELEKRFSELNEVLKKDLSLTLTPNPVEAGHSEEPLELVLPQADTGVGLDLQKLTADLDAGVGQERGDSYLLDPRDYLVWNDQNLQKTLNAFAEEYGTVFAPASDELGTVEDGDANANGVKPEKVLLVRSGVTGRGFTAEDLLETVREAWQLALVAEEPEAALQPVRSYDFQVPEPLDADQLYERYCKDAVEPQLEKSTGKVTEGKDGYAFDREALSAALENLAPGEELRVGIFTTHPQLTAKELRNTLFKDVIAEAHTTHTNIANRTNNLKLACKEIDGTILMPGEIFSFNKVVGQRTEEKGYKEAIAYVSGGESKPEVGGGICQVASSIYYAVLQADLKTVERQPHMYKVDYVPIGMDATIYWGSLDFKFQNNSPYPLKIEASVSGGKVHIKLLGTEWKDYTVKLSSEILETTEFEVVEKEVPNDGTYRNGEVITTGYTGYKVATYRTTRDKKTDKKIETTQIAISRYKKRDKVIAKVVGSPTNPTNPPAPTSKPTEKPTQKPTNPPPSSETPPPSSETPPPSSETPPPSSETPPPSTETPPPSSETPPPSSETPPPSSETPPPSSETPPPPSDEGGEENP